MKLFSKSLFKRISLLFAGCALIFVACQLSGTETENHSISFNKIYDSLAQYDSVVIALKDTAGHTIDIVFKGKVEKPSDVENLPAPHWDGGKVLVSITGFNNRVMVYKVETGFDGATNKKDSVYVFVYPGSSITSLLRELVLIEGDSITLPTITVSPATLTDKSLSWTSSNPECLVVGSTFLKAVKPGSAQLTIRLVSDTSKVMTIQVTIVVNGRIPESLALSADTLFVATGGAPGKLLVTVIPATAATAVTWRIEDSSIASVAGDGTVRGLKKGDTKLWAISKEKATILVFAIVDVSDPAPVATVRFLKDSTDLFIRGVAEVLQVEVLPKRANPEVEFTVSDPLKVGLVNGSITGLVEGDASVYVSSKENPLIKDTLRVHVLPSQIVDSVRLSALAFKLFTGGESQVLTAKVMPLIASPKIKWISSLPGVASVDGSGKVSPVSAGTVRIYAVSVADSLKKDSAEVTVKVVSRPTL